MPVINRNDLKYDYSWSTKPSDHPRSGVTETDSQSRVFQSDQGDEVLSLLNDYAEKHNIESKEKALILEMKIREEMDQKEMTRREVIVWLEKNA